jgi:hypothetical protein
MERKDATSICNSFKASDSSWIANIAASITQTGGRNYIRSIDKIINGRFMIIR